MRPWCINLFIQELLSLLIVDIRIKNEPPSDQVGIALSVYAIHRVPCVSSMIPQLCRATILHQLQGEWGGQLHQFLRVRGSRQPGIFAQLKDDKAKGDDDNDS